MGRMLCCQYIVQPLPALMHMLQAPSLNPTARLALRLPSHSNHKACSWPGSALPGLTCVLELCLEVVEAAE